MIKSISHSIVVLFFHFCALQSFTQSITNVHSQQIGNIIEVNYTLSTTSPCEIALYVSLDGGTSWKGPLAKVQGAVGKNISSGENAIIWQVLEELEELSSDRVKFKVTSVGKQPFEPEMVFVEGGSFIMGSEDFNDDEKPVHEVILSPFSIGRFEITQAQWKAVMGQNPSVYKNCNDCPIESVSWSDIQVYLSKINKITGKKYRLPTEAEWEYAAGGGNNNITYHFSGSNDLKEIAWYGENSENKPHVVGSKNANNLGIYDMSGNVWEWCSDYYGEYSSKSEYDPMGSDFGEFRVIRGGSWAHLRSDCRITMRVMFPENTKLKTLGFRLALSNP
jgi:formylglycine-generating enzyme required for sulfatase activity